MPAAKETWWTPEEDNLVKKLVADRLGFPEMVTHFPRRSARAIECRARGFGLKSGKPAKKYAKDEAFWEAPNTINSYYAGILAADGCLGHSNGGHVAWVCESGDEPYLRYFAYECKYTGVIAHHLKRSPRSEYISIHSHLRISSARKWLSDMARNFNLTPQKTYRLGPPPLGNDLLLCCYLIGYIDGDGCIYPNPQVGPQINFVSASPHIIHWVQRFIEAHFNFQVKLKPRKVRTSTNGRHHHYSIYGMTAAKFIDFMRKIDVPRFTRKWDQPEILAMIDGYRKKWPHLWTPENELSFDAGGNIVRGKIAPVVPFPDTSTQTVAA